MKEAGLLSRKISCLIFGLIGFLLVFFCRTGSDLAQNGNILWTAEYTLRLLAGCVLFGALPGAVCAGVCYTAFVRRSQKCTKAEAVKRQWGRIGSFVKKICAYVEKLSDRRFFCIVLLIIMLSWLPVFLAYYPGICAYDSPVQTGQAVGGSYIDHHPIAHTLLLKGAMELGGLLGNVNTGIALYTWLQQLLLAAAMSYGLLQLHTLRVRGSRQLVMLLFCMFYPFHWFMSVSVTKDTIFTAFWLVQSVSMARLLLEDKQSLRFGRTDICLLVSTIGMILFRNNGKYALLVPLFFLIFMLWRGRKARKLWGRLLLCLGGAFLAGNIALSAIYHGVNAEQGDRREMLSMPIQQLARCMLYHGGVGALSEDDNTMQEEDKALINDFLLNQAYLYYQPSLADPVKGLTNTYVVRYRTGDFITTYLRLLSQYPGDFINAMLAVDAGFLYPGDVSHAYVNVEENSHNMGYVQTHWEKETLAERGIYQASKWESLHQLLEKWSEDNAYLSLPVLKYLFVPGVFLWYYLVYLGVLLVRKEFRRCLPLSLTAGYYATMLLGPTVQLRYIYPVMITLPFLLLLKKGRKVVKN